MAEIRHLENRHNVIFSADYGPIWIKFRRPMQNDMSTVVMWSKSKPDVEFQYGGRFGKFNGTSSQSHLPHARCSHLAKSMSWSCHIAGCKNSIRHIENRFSPYFILFLFLMQFRLWRASAFVSSPIHFLLSRSSQQRDCGFTHRWCPSVCPFVCLSVYLSPKCENAIFLKSKQFRGIVSIDNL